MEKKTLVVIRAVTRILGIYIVYRAIMTLMGVSISGYMPPSEIIHTLRVILSWSYPMLVISGLGILFLKKWAWYLAIISSVVCLIQLFIYYPGLSQWIFVSWPLMVPPLYLLLPKVKEQFK